MIYLTFYVFVKNCENLPRIWVGEKILTRHNRHQEFQELKDSLTFILPLISSSVCDYRCQTPETQRSFSLLLSLWHYLIHFMALKAIVLRWIKIIC